MTPRKQAAKARKLRPYSLRVASAEKRLIAAAVKWYAAWYHTPDSFNRAIWHNKLKDAVIAYERAAGRRGK